MDLILLNLCAKKQNLILVSIILLKESLTYTAKTSYSKAI